MEPEKTEDILERYFSDRASAENEIECKRRFDEINKMADDLAIKLERAVLGGLMVNNDAYEVIAKSVTKEDFLDRDHGALFYVISFIIEQNKLASVITTKMVMVDAYGLDPEEVRSSLAGFIRESCSMDHMYQFTRLIGELAKDRKRRLTKEERHQAATLRGKAAWEKYKREHKNKPPVQQDADYIEYEYRNEPLSTMPYKSYLQTFEWQETRDKALSRALFSCQVCNGGGQLNVHHRSYARRGRELDSDLIVLCVRCHEIFHENGRLAPDPDRIDPTLLDSTRMPDD
jgi:DnaB-like helicase N terminal domain